MILLTDSISQSSNFCVIVLDETTYYITAFAVDSNNTVISSQTASITTDFWWHPSANTLAYYPLTSSTTVNDMSWNNRNWTKYWTINFSTYGWVNCAYFNGGSNYIQVPYDSWMSTSSITISLWAKTLEYNGNRWLVYKWQFTWQNWIYAIAITNVSWNYFDWRINTTPHWCNVFDWNNIWTHILVDFNWSTWHVYKNWILISTFSQSQSISSDTNKLILWAYWNSSYCFYWYLSNIIFEKKIRTQAEITEYFNKTKSIYGL